MMFVSCLLVWISVILSSSAQVNPCDSGWHYYNKTGSCYKTSTEIGTWFDGSGICSKMHAGAQLASLRSEDESRFVAKVHRNGPDGIHAWTGLSQTKTANNWTFTDGSKPWSSFILPYLFPSNHTSCVEILDNWLNELFNNTGKTQPIFCYHYRKALCKYVPTTLVSNATTTTTVRTPAARLEKAHPRSAQAEIVSGCSSGLTQNQNPVKLSSNGTVTSQVKDPKIPISKLPPTTTTTKTPKPPAVPAPIQAASSSNKTRTP